MQLKEGRVIRLWKSVDCSKPSADSDLSLDALPAGFYLAITRAAKKKKRRKSPSARAVTMYGPFAAVHAARFMETSAFALGLLPAAPARSSPSECADHAKLLPSADAARPSTGKASIVRLADSH